MCLEGTKKGSLPVFWFLYLSDIFFIYCGQGCTIHVFIENIGIFYEPGVICTDVRNVCP